MSQFDPFNPMGQFFQDEFIFNEENDGSSGASQNPGAFMENCAECGQSLIFGRDSTVVTCPVCGTEYAPNWSRLR